MGTRIPWTRLIGPLIALGGAIVTLPSMLGAGFDVQMNIGLWWTPAVIVVAVVLALLLLTWQPGARWRRRGVIGLSAFLILYGIAIGLWGLRVADERDVPAADLPYLLGLPAISAVAGVITLFVMRRLRKQLSGA